MCIGLFHHCDNKHTSTIQCYHCACHLLRPLRVTQNSLGNDLSLTRANKPLRTPMHGTTVIVHDQSLSLMLLLMKLLQYFFHGDTTTDLNCDTFQKRQCEKLNRECMLRSDSTTKML